VTQSTDANEIAVLRAKAPDSKETMEIGRDWDKIYKNKWPNEADVPGFKDTMLDFYQVSLFNTSSWDYLPNAFTRLATSSTCPS